jgi:integrase
MQRSDFMPSKIKKRGNDSYLLTVASGYNADGSQRVYTKTVHVESMEEAEKQYTLFAAACLQGKTLLAGGKKMTLSEFYTYWKHHHAEKNLENTTIAYNDNLFVRIEAALGSLKIDKIKPKHVLSFIDQISAPDASYDDKPLSPNTIYKHYALLNELFNSAVCWEFIINNPMTKIAAPKREKVKKHILNEEDMAKFIALLSQDVLKHKLWVMLAFTLGLRREEVFGLQWQDVNFDESSITIARAAVYIPKQGIDIKSTKSDNSYRTLSIPSDIKNMLQQWKEDVKAASKRRNKRKKIVSIEDPTSPEKWIFSQANGKVGHPHSFSTFLRRFYKDNDLHHVSPHLLRHMMGSYLLKSGIDLAAVSQKLGHANKSFTANTYIHALESAEKQTANVMQNILDDLKSQAKS